MKIFGYEIVRDSEEDQSQLVTPVTPQSDDGAITVQSPTLGLYLDMDATYRSELDLLHKYRQMSIQPEVENAINDIVDEAVVHDSDDGQIVKLNLDRLDTSDTVKERMTECFNKVIGLLQFNKYGDDIFRKWYVDGRLYYQMLIDEKSPINGIQQLIYIDSRKIRKVREVTKARKDGIDVIVGQTEYYLYNDKLTMNNPNSGNPLVQSAITEGGVKLSRDSVAQATSGLYDPIKATVLSYLHKAIRPVNQLRFVEDATVIYRVTRAPERRVFYVDTSGLSKIKAEQYLKNIMTNFRNKLNYDPCLAMDTKVKLLDGRNLTITELQAEHESGKQNWVYSCDPTTGKIQPGLISYAGLTKRNAKVAKVTFDNGKSVTCTLDHRFPVWNRGKVFAKDLKPGDSIIPLYTREKPIQGNRTYEQVFDHEKNKWEFTHRVVSRWKDENGIDNEWTYDPAISGEKRTIHHINYNRYDNSPSNLTRMNRDDHFSYHKQHNGLAGKIGGAKSRDLKKGFHGLSAEQRSENSRKNGLKVGPALGAWAHDNGKGIFAMTVEERHEHNFKASQSLQDKLRNDPVFYADYCSKIQASRTDGVKKQIAEANGLSFPDSIVEIVRTCALDGLSAKGTVETINAKKSLIDELNGLNVSKAKFANNPLDTFTYKHLKRVCSLNFGRKVAWEEYRDAMSHHNHKVISVEILEDRVDVGTVAVDKDEIYHGHHTYALDIGIFTFNTTGEIKDDRRHIAMLEDFWMPRNGEGKGTEITTLPAGQNLGQMEDVLYFKKALYRALSIPESRIENPQGLFNMGQPGTVTRDEIKFSKFIHTLRAKFSTLFDELMERQLVLTQVCTYEEWQQFKQDVYYVFTEDNNFSELKDQEILGLRLNMLTTIQPFMGVFFSKKYVWKNILRFEDDEVKEINKEIEEEHQAAMLEGRPQLAGFTPPVPPGAPEPVDEGPLAPSNADSANDNPVGQKKVADNLDGQTKAFLDK